MTLHDPSARLGHEKKTRRFRLRGFLRLRRLRADQAVGPGAPVRARDRRKLAAIDHRLAADAPALASMFAMFNGLAKAEGPVGVERLTVRARPWPRPRAVHVAVLLTLAAVAALFVVLSTQIHPTLRPCPTAAAAAATIAQPVHTTSCSAYATNTDK
jgi:hypothetical protein